MHTFTPISFGLTTVCLQILKKGLFGIFHKSVLVSKCWHLIPESTWGRGPTRALIKLDPFPALHQWSTRSVVKKICMLTIGVVVHKSIFWGEQEENQTKTLVLPLIKVFWRMKTQNWMTFCSKATTCHTYWMLRYRCVNHQLIPCEVSCWAPLTSRSKDSKLK